MMCAASIQENNPSAEIVLIERNDGLGKKVIISGGGRCNVTTGIHDVKLLLKKYPRGESSSRRRCSLFRRTRFTTGSSRAVYR